MSSGPENSPSSPHLTDVKISPCITEIQVACLDEPSNCVQWKWFSKLLLSTCGCIWQNSIMVSCAMPSEGSKVTHIQHSSIALPNTDWNFSGFPESYVWKMMKGLHPLQSCIEKCDFLNIWQFSQDIWLKVMSHDPSLL